MPRLPKYRLGIDLGGTKIHAVVLDRRGRVLGRARTATKAEKGYSAVVERIAHLADEARQAAGLKRGRIACCGIGAPGPVDADAGVLLLAPNLGWGRKPLADDLARAIDMPVVIGNDVNCGAMGEIAYGAARGARSAIAAFIGTGLGGAVVLDGQVLAGAHGYGGEIGHIPCPFSTARCGCGQRGCLETVASKTGIMRLLRERIASGEKARLALDDGLKAGALAEALRQRCTVTRAVVQQAIAALAWGLSAIGQAIDPEVYIIGGGVAEALRPHFVQSLARAMRTSCMLHRRHPPRIVAAQLGDDAVAIGAAVLGGERQ
ncbi:MAG: ROK family protein [Rhodocyclaceae bacterium]|nr:ROK family protein [Planctomycetota bacterium]MCX8016286.1 ROK family protein [Rhodocyclaceae bacterium]